MFNETLKISYTLAIQHPSDEALPNVAARVHNLFYFEAI